ncbi:phage portal protein [Cryobacterium sp. 1639]|uniref:phage portal protein n=1 Tax=Cryobacterium inferilacus TaxID=2866629 RepID=UPI001C73A605|nr:phage portal protein [Cryobacterium sp. 1639]MBX0299396.1 phage portal protein [Cryobacterium sp. 1639]
MSTKDVLDTLSAKLDESQAALAKLDTYYEGRQPAAFLSPKSQEALGNKLRMLSVNFPKLAVTSLAERLNLTGFRGIGEEAADVDLWRIWQQNDLTEQAHLAHLDSLVYGRSFVIVWAGAEGPRVTVESAKQVSAAYDPATGRVVAAVKRWTDGLTHYAVVYEADQITRYAGKENALLVVEVIPNPLGEVPVVPIVNRGRLLDFDGVSEMADILDLADGLNKVMSDAMVSSEYYARPRRWVTGLEIVEDDEGNPVNPFSSEGDRIWQSEAPETKFGQFDGSRLDGYSDLSATLTAQIGAISGLPGHYLGLHGDQPPSADAIRSAEASLVTRATAKQRTFGRAWEKVADLIVKVRDGQNTRDFQTLWASPENRTPAQVADAAAKLAGIGVPLESVLADPLGYSPSQIAQIRQARRAEALDASGADLSTFLVTAE